MKQGGSVLQNLKQENRNKIYNQIKKTCSISNSDLMYELKLSRPTITQNLSELLSDGFIVEDGYSERTGGRRAKAYSINENKYIAFGLDITEKHITIIAVNLNEKIIYEREYEYIFSTTESYYQKLGYIINLAVDEMTIAPKDILGVGIALPGLVSSDYQRIVYGKILDFEDMRADVLSDYIPYNLRLYNDASAGGYAEMSMYENINNAFYISLSNNIGGAIFINNTVYNGDDFRSGEIGHMTIDENGDMCYCGKRGCFETLCNARILSRNYNGNLERFFEELDKGNEVCWQTWKRYIKNLSVAVNNVHMLFDCKIILGGYVGTYMEKHMDEIRTLAAKRNTFRKSADYLHSCKAKKDILALGAALPFVHEMCARV